MHNQLCPICYRPAGVLEIHGRRICHDVVCMALADRYQGQVINPDREIEARARKVAGQKAGEYMDRALEKFDLRDMTAMQYDDLLRVIIDAHRQALQLEMVRILGADK